MMGHVSTRRSKRGNIDVREQGREGETCFQLCYVVSCQNVMLGAYCSIATQSDHYDIEKLRFYQNYCTLPN